MTTLNLIDGAHNHDTEDDERAVLTDGLGIESVHFLLYFLLFISVKRAIFMNFCQPIIKHTIRLY